MADIAYFLAENANSTSKNHRTFAPENKRYFSSSKKKSLSNGNK
ncbi:MULTISPECIES: hypothetical protein [Capnocytophaga]|nr:MULTISPECIES: hypothetical protein [Capnocytophaga]